MESHVNKIPWFLISFILLLTAAIMSFLKLFFCVWPLLITLDVGLTEAQEWRILSYVALSKLPAIGAAFAAWKGMFEPDIKRDMNCLGLTFLILSVLILFDEPLVLAFVSLLLLVVAGI